MPRNSSYSLHLHHAFGRDSLPLRYCLGADAAESLGEASIAPNGFLGLGQASRHWIVIGLRTAHSRMKARLSRKCKQKRKYIFQ